MSACMNLKKPWRSEQLGRRSGSSWQFGSWLSPSTPSSPTASRVSWIPPSSPSSFGPSQELRPSSAASSCSSPPRRVSDHFDCIPSFRFHFFRFSTSFHVCMLSQGLHLPTPAYAYMFNVNTTYCFTNINLRFSGPSNPKA